MSTNAQTLATRGFVTRDSNSDTTPGAMSVLTGIILNGYFTPIDKTGLGTVRNYEENIGLLTIYQEPDGSGIRLTVDPDFPDDYLGTYCILRGKYEYKTNPDDVNVTVIDEVSNPTPPSKTIVDTDVEPGAFYYYALVAIVQGAGEPAHFEYNPNTGAGSAYSYADRGMKDALYSKLPREYQDSDTDGFLGRFLDIFGQAFNTFVTDMETYLLHTKDVINIEEKQLEHLASLIGWSPTRELNELVTRAEIQAVPVIYERKGRNNSIEYNIQLISGWNVEFESGRDRVLRSDTPGHRSFNPDDPVLVANLGLPARVAADELLGSSDGSPNQTFDIGRPRARNIVIRVCELDGSCTNWREVSSLVGASDTDQVFVVSEDPVTLISTVTFGDAVTGSIPDSGLEIRTDYIHGGDKARYSQSETDGWRNPLGFRVLLEETGSSRPLDTPLFNRVRSIVDCLGASYALYKIAVSSFVEEGFHSFEDSHTDVVTPVSYLIMNSATDTMNDPEKIMASV